MAAMSSSFTWVLLVQILLLATTVLAGTNALGPDTILHRSKREDSQNRSMRAIAILEAPYVMLKADHADRTGNDRYKGYAVDLMDMVSEETNITYLLEHKDLPYGHFDPKRSQRMSLIGELIEGHADLIIGGVTISSSRENVIDFTVPFMHLGIGILYQKPVIGNPSSDWFLFLRPFSQGVWLYLQLAYIAVTVTAYLLGRILSNKKGTPSGSGNSTGFVSVRLTNGIFWFLTLVMISAYTASLASLLTVERHQRPIASNIRNAEDLAGQSDIKYGCYDGGATYDFFKNSKVPLYQRMWQTMNQDPSNFVNSSRMGIQRVKEGNYAYLMESPSLEYAANQNCSLMQIGGLLDSKGFGIAVRQNDTIRDKFSVSILKLQERGDLLVLKNKWWNTVATQDCKTAKEQNEADQLHTGNLGGVFILVFAGLVVCFGIGAVEVWRARRKTSNNEISAELI